MLQGMNMFSKLIMLMIAENMYLVTHSCANCYITQITLIARAALLKINYFSVLTSSWAVQNRPVSVIFSSR